MNIQHIFEGGHPVATIIGMVIFLAGGIWFGVLLPYAYDAWLMNKRIDLANASESLLKRRERAVDRLTEYYNFVIRYTCYKNPSNVLNDFGKHVVWFCLVNILLMLIGVFFPTAIRVVGAIILVTMWGGMIWFAPSNHNWLLVFFKKHGHLVPKSEEVNQRGHNEAEMLRNVIYGFLLYVLWFMFYDMGYVLRIHPLTCA